MGVLLDTHTMNCDDTLPLAARKTIRNIDNKCYFSIAGIWEIAIKHSLNKLELASGFDRIKDFMSENEIELLPLGFEHIQQLIKLDFHHRDPFDRIMISQAIVENLTILTKDSQFMKYPVRIIWG